MNRNVRAIFLVSASLVSITSNAAYAQEATAKQTQAKDMGIGEIVVTAQKKSSAFLSLSRPSRRKP